ncbi:NAD(P)-binding protein [Westerdykella ornata]|uniref:D-xylose 1-dehydrogenase (NADP(+), D-xylono-1,5-lactone-forming) n=1 Tax=Westerdykella ornata TaxID=318751 RepID=A0A6A6JX34_WESOR|nr:NAD(P)-binding protein [Westerdykella ornata]KAF2280378.1 NAD(P)-binding protein [Westerdykella ornata]
MSNTGPFTLKWGILATGGIAKTFTKDLLIPTTTRNASDIQHELVAAASSSSLSRAQTFLNEVGAPETAVPYASYADLVADPNVDIIYVATPHSHHYQHARLALEAGKHVLCEKAFTVNAAQAQILIDIAREKKLFLMEAMWTRFFPVAKEVRDIVKSGQLGEVIRVWADLSFWKDVEGEFGTAHRMVNLELAGGALLDLGVYSLTWVFQILYHIVPAEERGPPAVASAMTKYEATGCDETTSMILTFPGGAQGIATTSLRVAHHPTPTSPSAHAPIRIQGTLADIHIPYPPYRPQSYVLLPASNDARGTLASFPEQTVTREVPAGGHGMFYEADECARCIRDGKLESEVMPWEESLEVMRVMDLARRQGGLDYGDLEGTGYL